MVDGISLLVGYGMGITTLAVIWAIKKLRIKVIIDKGLEQVKQDEKKKEERIAKAKKQIEEAKKIILETEGKWNKAYPEEPKEQTQDIVLPKEKKPKAKKEDKEPKIQNIEIQE